ncbi:hypothetical protein C3F34_07605 [Acinetobacter sp. ACNIH2]|nr:hypothetical protein C3F34_07605 [Acinetobacter sp. ACNIH2]
MKAFLLSMSLGLVSLHTFADGYINENMVVFTSESDGSDDPWQDHPKCTPSIQAGGSSKSWLVQYFYSDQSPLTSGFITTQKPSNKASECEHLVHFPDQVQGSGTFESYYPNGKIRSHIEYEDGSYHGKLIFWHANGLKEQESTMNYGIPDGEYRIWHPNGQLALSMKYKDDMQDGMKQRWYADGKPWTYVRFENGVMRGELKQWFHNGKLERRGEYRNGLRQNRYEIWYEDGTPEAVLTYDAGSIIQAQCWNEAGKPRARNSCLSSYQDEE